MTKEATGFYPPAFVTLAVLLGSWFGGARTGIIYMLPALGTLVLFLAYTLPSPGVRGKLMTERSALRTLPIAVILVAAAYFMTPSVSLTAEPFSSAADRLRHYVEDYLFFRDARTVFSLKEQGYYPMGNEGLGGAAKPENNAVMEVVTDEKAYLRGAILNEYSGRSWYDSLSSQRYGYKSIRFGSLRDALFEKDYPLAGALPEKKVIVHMISGSASTLFTPQRLRNMVLGVDMVPYFNRSSELFITRNLKTGDSYTVTYADTRGDSPEMSGIAASCAPLTDTRLNQIEDTYLSLPSHFQKEIYDIAERAAAGASSPYEKAMAVRQYLRSNYSYTLDVPNPPTNVDFVSYFLLEGKAGYCTYFASAMTVLCRMAGLPARYVEGFVAEPSGGIAYVTGMDAHAWTEVYLNGTGWITFDATPGRGKADDPDKNGTPPPSEPSPSPSPEPENTPSPSPSAQETPSPEPDSALMPTPPPEDRNESEPDPEDQIPFPWIWILLLILAAALITWRYLATEPCRCADRAKDSGKAMLILFAAISSLPGDGLKAGETPADFAVRAEERYDIPLMGIAGFVNTAAYSRGKLPGDAVEKARLTYEAFKKRIPFRTRLRAVFFRMIRIRGKRLK